MNEFDGVPIEPISNTGSSVATTAAATGGSNGMSAEKMDVSTTESGETTLKTYDGLFTIETQQLLGGRTGTR